MYYIYILIIYKKYMFNIVVAGNVLIGWFNKPLYQYKKYYAPSFVCTKRPYSQDIKLYIFTESMAFKRQNSEGNSR